MAQIAAQLKLKNIKMLLNNATDLLKKERVIDKNKKEIEEIKSYKLLNKKKRNFGKSKQKYKPKFLELKQSLKEDIENINTNFKFRVKNNSSVKPQPLTAKDKILKENLLKLVKIEINKYPKENAELELSPRESNSIQTLVINNANIHLKQEQLRHKTTSLNKKSSPNNILEINSIKPYEARQIFKSYTSNDCYIPTLVNTISTEASEGNSTNRTIKKKKEIIFSFTSKRDKSVITRPVSINKENFSDFKKEIRSLANKKNPKFEKDVDKIVNSKPSIKIVSTMSSALSKIYKENKIKEIPDIFHKMAYPYKIKSNEVLVKFEPKLTVLSKKLDLKNIYNISRLSSRAKEKQETSARSLMNQPPISYS